MSEEVKVVSGEAPEAYSISDYFKKPNFLISAKYKSSLLENKILVVSLANLSVYKNCEEDSETGILYSHIYASELIDVLGTNKGSFYRSLDTVAKKMAGRVIGITNPDTQEFEYISIISHAYYKKGVLTIGYNPLVKSRLLNLKDDFTFQSKLLMLTFGNIYAFRLYELLRSKAYVPKWMMNTSRVLNDELFKIEYGLAELKFELGVADADDSKSREILGNKLNPNYELALEKCSEQVFKDWYEFKRKVLDVAVKEINNSKYSDIRIEYEPVKSGVGGKVVGIIFIVYRKQGAVKDVKIHKVELSEKEMDDILDAISELIDVPLKIKDIRSIAEAAGYDMAKVKKANKILVNYGKSHDVSNVVGFLINNIKGDAGLVERKADEKKEGVREKKKGKCKNQFNNFEQRKLDFEALEKDLLAN